MSEIFDCFKITIGSCNLCNLPDGYVCWKLVCLAMSKTISCLSCSEADQATMHRNELPMFAYNLWMSWLCPDHATICVRLSTLQ